MTRSGIDECSFNRIPSSRSQHNLLEGGCFSSNRNIMVINCPHILMSEKPVQRSNFTSNEEYLKDKLILDSDDGRSCRILIFGVTPNSGRTSVPSMDEFAKETIYRKCEEDLKLRKQIQQLPKEEYRKLVEENLTLGSDGKPYKMLVFRGTPKSGRTSVPLIDEFMKEEIHRKHEEDLKLRKRIQKLPKSPDKCLDVPNLMDNFYINPIDWGQNNLLAVALRSEVYLRNAGKLLASDSNDNIIKIWEASDLRSDRVVRRLKDHCATVKALAWCPHQYNALVYAGGTTDWCIKMWNLQTGKCIRSMDTTTREELQKMAEENLTLDSGARPPPTSDPHFEEFAKGEIQKKCKEAPKLPKRIQEFPESTDCCFETRKKKRVDEVGSSSYDFGLRPVLQLPGKNGRKLLLLAKTLESGTVQVIDCLSMEFFLRSEVGFINSYMLCTKLDGWMLMFRNDLNCPFYFNFVTKRYIVLPSLPDDVYFPKPHGSFDLKPTDRSNTTVLIGNIQNWDGLHTVIFVKKTYDISWTRYDLNNLSNEIRTQINGPIVYNNTLVWISNGNLVEVQNQRGQYRSFTLNAFLPNTPTSLIRRFTDIYVVQDNGSRDALPSLVKIMMGSDPFEGEIVFEYMYSVPPLDLMVVKGREGACVSSDEACMFMACQFQHHLSTCRAVGDGVVRTQNLRCGGCNCEGGFIYQ